MTPKILLAPALSLLLLSVTLAAPVPPARPLPDLAPGVYALEWGGDTYRAFLLEGGYYYCTSGQADWHGRWEWDAAGRLLCVTEGGTAYPREEAAYRWYARLDRNLTSERGPLWLGPRWMSPEATTVRCRLRRLR